MSKQIVKVIKQNISLDENREIVDKLFQKDYYQAKIEQLDNETIEKIATNQSIALEYAQKGIQKVDPDQLTEKYINFVAASMQKLARQILQERTKK